MKIELTESAVHQLQSLKLTDGQLPRIDANMKGGCGLAIDYLFLVDERRKNDYIYQTNGISIQMDHFTRRYLAEDTVTIDYTTEFLVLSEVDFDSSC
ncbi:iron-sulfur cluster biosynthesis family protein [Gracilibacillus sp. S3-1-1]|uniref:Iron-sulfur cluster biosynthesis family protein n=1 Tax=Gracilibacillus pellucidus TaxID=3095368 RepID=A0ACC6M082_9BACI|nr:iron-sulfur cluster biosynthesis family protein [Gracilibacillus sp. S3-1-1]MDX8044354.1 iron-sulfur cluster biosynthesis family protein [Gracilibacillus sp. S3-1-1]